MTDTYRIVVSEKVLEHARNALLGDRRLHHYCSTCTAFRKAMMLAEFHPDIPDEEEVIGIPDGGFGPYIPRRRVP